MKNVTGLFVALALLARCAWADVPPDEFRGEVSDAVWILLCVLPALGAFCLYRVMRHRT